MERKLQSLFATQVIASSCESWELRSRARINGMAISIRIESVFPGMGRSWGDRRSKTLALHGYAVKMKKRRPWTVHFDCETACRHCLSISYVHAAEETN